MSEKILSLPEVESLYAEAIRLNIDLSRLGTNQDLPALFNSLKAETDEQKREELLNEVSSTGLMLQALLYESSSFKGFWAQFF